MWLAHPPKFVKGVYPSLYWKIPTEKREIFITFDDGPTPGVTDRALDMLGQYDAHATFFCLGKNAAKNSRLFKRVLNENHVIGNHTYNHVNGWKTNLDTYYREINLTKEVFKSELFRPPYGRIRPAQIKRIGKAYKIIMWSNLSMDFNHKYSKQQCLNMSLENIDKGSIIVLHDSEKAANRMFYALEGILKYCKKNGWTCSAIKF